jgi:hypothetical protein
MSQGLSYSRRITLVPARILLKLCLLSVSLLPFHPFLISAAKQYDSGSTGSISGKVVRAYDGAELSGIVVLVYDTSWHYLKDTATDATGVYSLTGLATGNYYVYARPAAQQTHGYFPTYYNNVLNSGDATSVSVVAGADTVNINFSFKLRAAISGRIVRDSDGTVIPLILTKLFDRSGNFIQSVGTSPAGTYTLGFLLPGTYYVGTDNSLGFRNEYYNNVAELSAATQIEVTEGANIQGINFGLTSEGSSRSISGRVTRASDSAGVSAASVYIWGSDWNYIKFVYTDPSGNYDIPGLAAGRYFLRTSNTQGLVDVYYNSATDPNTAISVTVSEETDTSNIDFCLAAGGAIAGQVSRFSDGTGISGVSLSVYDTGWKLAKNGVTGSSGSYGITGLAAGTYYLSTSNNQGFVDKYFNNVIAKNSATAIEVTAGTTAANIDFSLSIGGSISGKVTFVSDGSMVPSVPMEVYDRQFNLLKSTATDATGSYIFDGLPAGYYYVKASNRMGFVDAYYNGVASGGLATAIAVTVGATTQNINFSLALSGIIVGRVTRDSDGAGNSGVYIHAYRSDNGLKPEKSAITDASGYYSLEGLAYGLHYFQTSNAAGFQDKYYSNAAAQGSATPKMIGLGYSGELYFSLAYSNLTASISGKVTRDSDAAGIVNVYVIAYDSAYNIIKSVVTDSSGSYSITGLSAGNYYLKTSTTLGYIEEYYRDTTYQNEGTAVSITAGAHISNINFSLANVNAYGTISGKVSRDSDGTAISGAVVYAYALDSGLASSKTATTDSSGTYVMTGLEAGRYLVKASIQMYMEEYYGNAASGSTATAVAVATGTITQNINLSLSSAGLLSGWVKRDSDGIGIPGVWVTAYSMSNGMNPVKSVITDSSGYYGFDRLAPITYIVGTSNSSCFLDKFYNNVTTAESATGVTVAAGVEKPGISFSLSLGTATGSISGKITRSFDGSPIAGIFVLVYSTNYNLIKSATTDALGNYSLAGLAAGSYFVRTSNSLGFMDKYYNNVISQANPTPVPVIAGMNSSNISFGLAPSGSLSGRVTRDSDGTAISNVSVYAYDSSWILVTSKTTDSAGAYIFTDLPAGSYYVEASPSGRFIEEYYDNVTNWYEAASVAVAGKKPTANIDFSLAFSSSGGNGTISGRLTRDSDGVGIAGISVYAYDTQWRWVAYSPPSDSSGIYNISELPPGSYYLKTSDTAGYVSQYYNNAYFQSSAVAVAVGSETNVSEINFILPALKKRRGQLTSE